MRRLTIICILLAIVLLFDILAAPSETHYLIGKVLFGVKPATRVWVIVDGTKVRTLTGDDGRYYLGGSAVGTYTVIVRRTPNGPDLFKQQVKVPSAKEFNITLR